MLNTNQMELGFDRVAALGSLPPRRDLKARWWFQQMRRVVELAGEWKPVPHGRAEQSYMRLTARRC